MAWLTVNFNSDSLYIPVMLDVLIPQGHGGYKTLYLLHGAGGDHASWLTRSRVADYVDGTSLAVVMPSGNNKCYVNNRYGLKYEDFITYELIHKCETWFSLSAEKKDRFIAGMSMGGYGAIRSALIRPDLYSAAYSYSGLLDIVQRYENPQGLNLYPVFGEKEELYTANGGLKELFHKMSGSFTENVENTTRFFITCGLEDNRIQMSKDCYQEMKNLGYRATYVEEPGAHNFDYWDMCIQNTVKQITGKRNLIQTPAWEEAERSMLCQ